MLKCLFKVPNEDISFQDFVLNSLLLTLNSYLTNVFLPYKQQIRILNNTIQYNKWEISKLFLLDGHFKNIRRSDCGIEPRTK